MQVLPGDVRLNTIYSAKKHNVMNIASHNTFTFLKPKKWWAKPFAFVAKCQEIPITEQWRIGVRSFDLRIRFRKDGTPYFCHGLVEYDGDVTTELLRIDELAANDKTVAVCRVMFEDNMFTVDRDEQIELFKRFCEHVNYKIQYCHIKFYGGYSKKEWKPLYDFEDKFSVFEKHASVSGEWFDMICPRWYALRNNLRNRAVASEDRQSALMIDFVNL